MKKLFFIAVALAVFSLAFGQTSKDWRQKTDAALLGKTAGGQSVPFIILMQKQADVSAARQLKTKGEKATFVFNKLRQTAGETQAGVIHFLKQKNAPVERLFIVNALKTEGTSGLIQALAQRPDVAYVMDNPALRSAEPVERLEGVVNVRSTIEWGLEMINADDVWAMGYRGQGAVIGGADTGFDWTHPALKNKYRGYHVLFDTVDHNYSWHDAIHSISPLNSDSLNPCGLDSKVPCDDGSHGTHTMGTMAGSDGDNEIGVAPDAKWCACRNMERGWGSPFTYLECFQWFMAPTDLNDENPDPSKSPDVINNSWYCPEIEGCNPSNWQLMNLAVNNLRFAGVVVVVSAGNSGSGCSSVSYPAAMFEGSFSVGATASNDTITGFSSRGPVIADGSGRLKPNVVAPGQNVRSSVPGGGYANFSGTSMAGPHVAGLVALVISANPELAGQVELIEDIIEQTAVPKTTGQNCGSIPGTEVPNHTYGYGRVDALAAVEMALSLITPVQEQAPVSVKVFPNPFENRLNFDIRNAGGDVQFELFGLNGRLLLMQRWNAVSGAPLSVDLTEKPAGIYFYRLLCGKEVMQGKVVKR